MSPARSRQYRPTAAHRVLRVGALVLVLLGATALLGACARPNAVRPGPGPTGPLDGRALFASSCGSCHTLAAAGTHGRNGPDLDARRMSVAEVVSFARVMPVRRKLSERELRAVSAYVAVHGGARG